MLRQNNLDDMRFNELSNKARMSISKYFPQWTDINTHDPGITLIELFAWLTEQQRFYMDRSEEAYPFFPLLGIKLRHASAARARIEIPGGFAPCDISANTPLYAEDVRFEVKEDIRYIGEPLTLYAIQRETIEAPVILGNANGYPHETFRVEIKGQIILDFALSVSGEAWTMADDFRASRPYDRHYTLNRETGEVSFGDGIRGELPYGEVAVTAMSITRGPGGNIAPNRISELLGMPVTQPLAAEGGTLRETVEQALRRFEAGREQAATAEGIERLVRKTPGLDIAKVKAFEQDSAPKLGKPRIITIAVKLKEGLLTPAAKQRICGRLEPYRIACREFLVVEAKILRVELKLEICAVPHGVRFKEELESKVRAFFEANFNTFGAVLSVSELRAFILDVPEVSEVTHCAFRVYGGAKISSDGDVTPEQDVIAELSELSLRIVSE